MPHDDFSPRKGLTQLREPAFELPTLVTSFDLTNQDTDVVGDERLKNFLGRLGGGGGSGGGIGEDISGIANIGALLASLFGFSQTGFPEFDLPEQEFGREQAGLLASRFESNLARTGASRLEREGLTSPSRSLAVRSQAGQQGNLLLANLLQSIDETNLRRSLAQFQTGAQRQERKGDIFSTIGGLAGAFSLLPGPQQPIAAGIAGVSGLLGRIF